MSRADIFCYGGGVQSSAIACLIVAGKLPRPERIIMADTGREATATWDYLRDHVGPLLATVGLAVEIAPHSLAKVDLYAKGSSAPLIPFFTATGKSWTFCSVEWKRRVVLRYLREAGYGTRRPVREWLGISTDEFLRAKPSATKWAEHWYPLIFEVPSSRPECVSLVRSAGLPTPPRSSCWMCPHRNNLQWLNLKASDFDKAVALEREMRERDPDVFLHRSRVPLDAVVFDAPSTQGVLDFCEEGRCEF